MPWRVLPDFSGSHPLGIALLGRQSWRVLPDFFKKSSTGYCPFSGRHSWRGLPDFYSGFSPVMLLPPFVGDRSLKTFKVSG
jgi:hypothetical protein